MLLSPQQLAQFSRDGFLVLDRILDPAQVARGHAAMTRIYAGVIGHDRRPEGSRPAVQQWPADVVKHYVHARFLDDDFWDIATSERPARLAAELLGTKSVSLTEDQLLEKPAGGKPLAMHQDYSYWGFSDIPRMATVWVTFNDVTADMGPIRFIKGSHRWGLAPTPTNFAGGTEEQMMDAVSKICPAGEKLEFVDVVVPAGGGSIHHAMAIHGSLANRTKTARHAISLHYAAAECRCTGPRQCWPDFMWEGIEKGDRLANRWMPITYTAGA